MAISLMTLVVWGFMMLGLIGLIGGLCFVLFWSYYSFKEYYWKRNLPEKIKQEIEEKNAENKKGRERARKFYEDGGRIELEGGNGKTFGNSKTAERKDRNLRSTDNVKKPRDIQIPSSSGNIKNFTGFNGEHGSSKKDWEKFD